MCSSPARRGGGLLTGAHRPSTHGWTSQSPANTSGGRWRIVRSERGKPRSKMGTAFGQRMRCTIGLRKREEARLDRREQVGLMTARRPRHERRPRRAADDGPLRVVRVCVPHAGHRARLRRGDTSGRWGSRGARSRRDGGCGRGAVATPRKRAGGRPADATIRYLRGISVDCYQQRYGGSCTS